MQIRHVILPLQYICWSDLNRDSTWDVAQHLMVNRL